VICSTEVIRLETVRRRWVRGRAVVLVVLLSLAGCQSALGPGRPGQEERNAYRQALALEDTDPAGAARQLETFLTTWPRSSLADDAGLALARIKKKQGDVAGAQRVLVQVVEKLPAGDKTDIARYRLAVLQQEAGQADAARRTAGRIQISRLPAADRRLVERLLADLAGETGDPVTQVFWLSQLYEETKDDEERLAIDAEIDQVVLGMTSVQVSRSAEQMRDGPITLRLHLRLVELAAARGDLDGARDALRRTRGHDARQLDEDRLRSLEVQLGLRAPEPSFSLPPRLGALGRISRPDPERAQGVLGVALPLTGAYAPFGEESLQGILLATGILDAQASPARPATIRVRVRDTGSNAAGAERAVRDLARDSDVSAIIGPLALRETEGAASAARDEQVPLLSLSRRVPESGENLWEFRLGLAPEDEAQLLVEYAAQDLGAERYALLYPRDRYGRTLRALFWDAAEEQGGELVAVSSYDPGATDFSEAIRKLVGFGFLSPKEKALIAERDRLLDRAKRHPPERARELRDEAAALVAPDGSPLPPVVDFDVLFVPDSHENIVLIAPQLAFHGITGVALLGTSGWNHPDLVRIGQKHVEGAVFTAGLAGVGGHPYHDEFAQRFSATFQRPPDTFAAQAYDAATLVMQQWIRGSESREDVQEALLGLEDQAGASGVFSIDDNGNAVRRPHLLSIDKGTITSLD
jgi:ABC-type branched-subunit amino acid transport system substrate-binding protein/predicted negative regulator of RcsB-dependent stress response